MPIQLRDSDSQIRKTAARIAKRNGLTSTAEAIRYAVFFTDGAERTERPPLDYASCDLQTLRTLIVFGYDHITRSAALDHYLARIKAAQS